MGFLGFLSVFNPLEFAFSIEAEIRVFGEAFRFYLSKFCFSNEGHALSFFQLCLAHNFFLVPLLRYRYYHNLLDSSLQMHFFFFCSSLYVIRPPLRITNKFETTVFCVVCSSIVGTPEMAFVIGSSMLIFEDSLSNKGSFFIIICCAISLLIVACCFNDKNLH